MFKILLLEVIVSAKVKASMNKSVMDLPIVYHPDYVVALPAGHRFPMPKFRQLYEMLLADGVAHLEQFHVPVLPPLEWIQLVHDPSYVQAYC